jgi:hypothetical protein
MLGALIGFLSSALKVLTKATSRAEKFLVSSMKQRFTFAFQCVIVFLLANPRSKNKFTLKSKKETQERC